MSENHRPTIKNMLDSYAYRQRDDLWQDVLDSVLAMSDDRTPYVTPYFQKLFFAKMSEYTKCDDMLIRLSTKLCVAGLDSSPF